MKNIIPYDETNSPSVAAGATGTIYTFAVPIKAKMRVTGFANYLADVAGWTYITWAINRNGIGVYPYNAIKDQIGYSAQVQLTQPIYFSGGDVMTVTAANAHGATTFVCGARILFELYEE